MVEFFFCAGVFPHKTPEQIFISVDDFGGHSKRCFCRLCWGRHSAYPNLLISPDGKGFHRFVGSFEIDRSSNKRMKANSRLRQARPSPLRSLLLATNPTVRKE